MKALFLAVAASTVRTLVVLVVRTRPRGGPRLAWLAPLVIALTSPATWPWYVLPSLLLLAVDAAVVGDRGARPGARRWVVALTLGVMALQLAKERGGYGMGLGLWWALLLGAVEVVVRLHPGTDSAVHPQLGQLVGVATVLDVQRAVLPVVTTTEPSVALGLAEVGQAVAIAPAPGPEAFPLVEVVGVAAHVDEAVDRGGAAEDLAPRAVHAPAVEARLGGGVVAPVVPGAVHRDGERRGHLDEDAAVAAAEFEEQDAGSRILGQARGEDAAGGSGADDDVVVGVAHGGLRQREMAGAGADAARSG